MHITIVLFKHLNPKPRLVGTPWAHDNGCSLINVHVSELLIRSMSLPDELFIHQPKFSR